MDQIIDPVGTPDAYRASGLAALGDADRPRFRHGPPTRCAFS
jgi:hypothetical protein